MPTGLYFGSIRFAKSIKNRFELLNNQRRVDKKISAPNRNISAFSIRFLLVSLFEWEEKESICPR
jgi:hypothetical protein